MASITINYPDDQQSRIVNAFCTLGNYDAYVASGGTMTKGAFTKKMLIDYIKSVVTMQERKDSEKAALAAIVDAPEVTPS